MGISLLLFRAVEGLPVGRECPFPKHLMGSSLPIAHGQSRA